MLKKIYDKNNSQDVIKFNDLVTLKDLMVCIVPGSKIKWKGEKKRYKCIARSDNFIIVSKPFNLEKKL